MDLSGRTILITGAGARIGHALGLAVARAGANVVAHYRDSADGAGAVASAAEQAGNRGVALQADLADNRAVAGLIARAAGLVGRPIDVLVNNASIFENVELMQTTLDVWQRNLQIHLTAPFLLSQAFVAHRREQPATGAGAAVSASIVNMLDHRALRPGADHFAYTISKAGLAAMTRSLAQAAAPDVRVNAVALGLILPAVDGSDDRTTMFRRTPAGRAGTLNEVIDAISFLIAGPAYITGEILHVDGGRHLT
ncbi:MAG: SDR family oxidoreductase [Planctomycetota bacterium]